ncbi:hypothetical protein U9M48_008504 [Paspalum notatum var. saurae]|uniref:Integrase catalytic domain-containing protein n=1 Tax=Paspalum notatum var. saurae TaxID=547442 RepID=A0AAQ3SP56_PASNO
MAELFNLIIEPTLKEQSIAAQKQDLGMARICDEIDDTKKACFTLDDQGVLWFKHRLVVPKDMELRRKILDEAHTSMFTMHPDSNKMYLRSKAKILVDSYKTRNRQRIKADHLKRAGMLHPLTIPTGNGKMCTWTSLSDFREPGRIVSLHGVPHTITSDRGSLFVSRFWKQLQVALGTNLIRSSAYHPQTSGQVERVNQILEDMLRACALTYSTKWDECLPLAEFAYNNSYQKSLEMAPFKDLYGRRCRTPLNWSELGERVTFGPDLVTQAEE